MISLLRIVYDAKRGIAHFFHRLSASCHTALNKTRFCILFTGFIRVARVSMPSGWFITGKLWSFVVMILVRDTCLAIERHGTEGDIHANIRASDADQL